LRRYTEGIFTDDTAAVGRNFFKQFFIFPRVGYIQAAGHDNKGFSFSRQGAAMGAGVNSAGTAANNDDAVLGPGSTERLRNISSVGGGFTGPDNGDTEGMRRR